MSVVYNGTAYFYTVNLQGDVVAIVDATGTAVVSYAYDAWGNILSVTGTMADTLGESNPLRYRGYVYDNETDLYYLQSRYYDPEVGRFINADVFVATGQGTLGNNMFVYCTNNPVNFLDPAGTISWAIFGDRHLLNPNMIRDFGGGGRPYANGGVSTHGSSITIKEFLDTDNPEVVFEQLEKYGMSYYNGFPVFQASLGDGGAFSCGIIVLDDYYTYNWAGVVTLNHEYGHRLHMDDIGIINYILTTAAPSLLHAGLSKLGLVKNYYSLPWERVADIYGGVNRNNYVPGSERNAMMFWVYTLLVSELTGGI